MIRKATMKDINGILSLWTDFVAEHGRLIVEKSPHKKPRRELIKNPKRVYKKFLTKCIRSRLSLVLVAELHQKVVGFVVCQIKKYDSLFLLENYGTIHDIYVDKRYRKQKISSRFKGAAVNWFKSKKLKYISLDVNSENQRARKIYKKWGFHEEFTQMWKRI